MTARETFANSRYGIEIGTVEPGAEILLSDLGTGLRFADSAYRYSVAVDDGTQVQRLDGLTDARLSRDDGADRTLFTITGLLGQGEPRVRLRHVITAFPDRDYLEETISLGNESSIPLTLRDYRIAFRKELRFDPESRTWRDGIGKFRLIAIPFRIQPDGKTHDYTIEDVYHGRFLTSVFDNPMQTKHEVVDTGRGRSEAWAWTDGQTGVLVTKYNPDMIEHSMLETERVGENVYLNFGGAAPCLYDEPQEAKRLVPGREVTFGVTRYTLYRGDYRRAAYLFRDHMTLLGHGVPKDYDPPVNWNELFDVGWYHSNPELLRQHYTLEALRAEAEKARDIGCELLYLDPGWETCEGETIWDSSRLGPVQDFVRDMRKSYGLEVAFRTIGRCYRNAYPGLYRRNPDGSVGHYGEYSEVPFYEPCTAYRAFLSEKLDRIVKVAGSGMKFIMFDEFDWRGPCFEGSHGHAVPTTPDQHARNIIWLIQKVHEQCPDILIEAHDPIWPWGVRYLPVYYLHDLPGSFDEGWAFEFMWNPIEDLLSGRALCLYYYNLAYELPLYNHITMENDNDNCLAFWWYASTVRHPGIGGKKGLTGKSENETRYAAYKKAMALYLSLKGLYTRGKFYGIDELTHLHVLPEEGRGVLNAFNLTEEHVSREVGLNLPDFGLPADVSVEGAEARVEVGRLTIRCEIPPMSPVVISFGSFC